MSSGTPRSIETPIWEMTAAWCPPSDSPLLGGSPAEASVRKAPDRDNPSGASTEPGIALEAEHISKSYRRGWKRTANQVLTDASITVDSGEIVGLVGENGSGKSTLMKILVGSLDSDDGHVNIRGTFGYCPQEPMLYERLTCDEHFELFGEAYSLDSSEIKRSRENIYDVFGFVGYRDRRVEDLSGGTRAKLNLGLALLHDPDILLLDEPYAGFDWDTYLRFWELTGERRDAGRAVLIISHFAADQERFDRIVQLSDGKTSQ